MSYGNAIARIFRMDEATWERHANPWSFWTRLVIAPLFALAVWSRIWIGWWCLVPVALLLVWTWINPRAFARPSSTDNWASRAVMGERVWLNRKAVAIPRRHARMADILSLAATLGMVPLVWGLIVLDAWMMMTGLVLAIGAKLWFLDRMVWLFEDMKERHPPYARWLR
jgi:hypothetical protein